MSYFKVFSYYFMLISFISFFMGVVFMISGIGFYLDWDFLGFWGVELSACFLADWISLIFSSFVLLISSCVMLYSEDYMGSDSEKFRFSVLVFLFVLSMLLMINSPNLLSLLLGWDGLGLVSYLLVIYYQNMRSYSAGMLTLMLNRVGDAALLMSISWMVSCGTWQYDVMHGNDQFSMAIVAGFCIFAGMTKSAQIPFSAWLPAAMAAPTPVSALVHSSTLVTAGVYLLIRFDCVKLVWSGGCTVLLLLSVLTMLMAGIGANYEFDLKKVIALSTLSQLGLMMFILAMGYEKLALFHLLSHAMFKACLFLCAGSYIHSNGDNQDLRVSGNLVLNSPFTSMSIMVCNLALMGFPFLAGFYSSDLLIEVYLMGGFGGFINFFLMVSIGLTSCYSMRLSYYLLWKNESNFCYSLGGDCGIWMVFPIFVLSFMAVVSGGFMSWILFPEPSSIFLVSGFKLMILFLVVGGMGVGSLVHWGFSSDFGVFINFLGSMWFLSEVSGQVLYKGVMSTGDEVKRLSDSGWSELVGGQGLNKDLMIGSVEGQNWQMRVYKLYMLFFFTFVLFVLFF